MIYFVVANYLNLFSEMHRFLNAADFLLKLQESGVACNCQSIRLFLFFEQVFDFNLLVYRRIYAFCFFLFLVNKYPQNIYNVSQETLRIAGNVCTLSNEYAIFEFMRNLYIFYITQGLIIRRKEYVKANCIVFNIYNLFLFPGFLNCHEDFEDLRFCSLKIIIILSKSGIYMRLFTSSLNFRILC